MSITPSGRHEIAESEIPGDLGVVGLDIETADAQIGR
jgi:hypothetical protein